MTITSTPPGPAPGTTSRRRVLAGLGALAVAPAALAAETALPGLAAPAHAEPDGGREAAEPACLADLVEMGVVTRADFMAG